MIYKVDETGRFDKRPFFYPEDIEHMCENEISDFLGGLLDINQFPITTDNFTKLIESKTYELDLYADMAYFGLSDSVEGFTEYSSARLPSVYINQRLSRHKYQEPRLRTTLAHEYGHVLLHSPLFYQNSQCKIIQPPDQWARPVSRTIAQRAVSRDWMEWQANYAMGALLMPRSMVSAVCTWYGGRYGFYPPFPLRTGHGRDLIECITKKFAVSSDAAEIRLKHLFQIT